VARRDHCSGKHRVSRISTSAVTYGCFAQKLALQEVDVIKNAIVAGIDIGRAFADTAPQLYAGILGTVAQGTHLVPGSSASVSTGYVMLLLAKQTQLHCDLAIAVNVLVGVSLPACTPCVGLLASKLVNATKQASVAVAGGYDGLRRGWHRYSRWSGCHHFIGIQYTLSGIIKDK